MINNAQTYKQKIRVVIVLGAADVSLPSLRRMHAGQALRGGVGLYVIPNEPECTVELT